MFRLLGSAVRGAVWLANQPVRAVRSLSNDPAVQGAFRRGQTEVAEALRPFPTSNAMKTDVGYYGQRQPSPLAGMGRVEPPAQAQGQNIRRGVSL